MPGSALGPVRIRSSELGPTGVGEESLAPNWAFRAGESWPCPGLTAEASGSLDTSTHCPSPPHTQPAAEKAGIHSSQALSKPPSTWVAGPAPGSGNVNMMVLQTCFLGRKVRPQARWVMTSTGSGSEHCRQKERMAGKTQESKRSGSAWHASGASFHQPLNCQNKKRI